ncbi:hypothetical protein [Rhodobacter ferrooxidans]|uniref:Uncharacterized protein n=1 Tax=Rhodobacter ferrooxidans TaxID=371731 RepID=C8RZT5_9RHOB|nr:hypothetical protein [Rhodobacter sp. SW2]EEW25882.1 conserved hypothetical protein [Rhodobacter sp. SW2]
MKKSLLTATAVVCLASLGASAAMAGPIERACLNSDRQAANRAVCACIQQVADQTLRGADQRRAAKFFSDPEAAHKVWLSKSASDDAFWDRYKNFGASAEAYCAG